VCPLVHLHAGAVITDVAFECLAGEAAVDVVDGTGASLRNVSAVGAAAFRAASAEGVPMAGFTASVSSNQRVIAAIGNGVGRFSVECLLPGEIVTQRQGNAGVTYSSACQSVDVGLLLQVYGREYETMFYHKNAEVDLYDSVERSLLYWVGIADLVLVAVMLVTHRDALVTLSQYTSV